MSVPIALTIAGSDSSGGAGIQADLKTFAAHQVFGASVIVALTAQNTQGVTGIHAVPADFVAAQIDAVFSDLDVAAVKIGMLATTELIETVAAGLIRHKARNIVLDPVMVAASGAKLLQDDAIDAIRRHLFPLATLVTAASQDLRISTVHAPRKESNVSPMNATCRSSSAAVGGRSKQPPIASMRTLPCGTR